MKFPFNYLAVSSLLCLCLFLTNCGSKVASKESDKKDEKEMADKSDAEAYKQKLLESTLSDVPPSHCKIRAKVVEILPIQEGDKKRHEIYVDNPARANIQIESILQCGSGVSKIPVENSIRQAFFAHTLMPAKVAYKEEQNEKINALSGLKVGDIFEAIVESGESLSPNPVLNINYYLKVQ